MTQEFHISVTPVGEDEYLIRTERVAPGVPLAEEKVKWPVDHWLQQARQLMDDPLLGLLRVNEADDPDLEKQDDRRHSVLNLVDLGQELFTGLFQGTMRDSWLIAQGIAQHRGDGLRLRLGLKGPRLAFLPWEVLYHYDRPIATGADVLFSRYQPGTVLITPSRSDRQSNESQNLKILMVLAAPTDQECLALEREANHLKEELESQSPSGTKIELSILSQPDREQLTDALEQGQYQVFHYAGHSSLGAGGGQLYLVSRKTGLSETVSGHDLAGLLANNGIKLTVFNSCRGAHHGSSGLTNDTGERNLAQALVKRDIPAVLAMAERIPDDVALTLSQLFYRNINKGYSVDLSLSRARQGLISAYGSNQLYWALPILYLHPEFDGYLTAHHQSHYSNEIPLETGVIGQNRSKKSQRLLSNFLPVNHGMFLDDPDALDEIDPENWDDFVDDVESDDRSEDSALVSDLLRQLANEPAVNTTPTQPNDQQKLELNSVGEISNVNSQSFSNHNVSGLVKNDADSHQYPAHLTEHQNYASANNFLAINWQKSRQKFPIVWPVLAALAVTGIAFLGTWIWSGKNFQIEVPDADKSSLAPTSGQLTAKDFLKNIDNKTITTIAISAFNRGDLATGQQAIEELLKPERGGLKYAKEALTALPNQKDTPVISFLRGRLAWQSVQAGDANFSIDDARRYWETAIKGGSKLALYYNALGFAYYAEGNLKQANEAWFQALYLHEEKKASNHNLVMSTDALTSYAGLALAFVKTAQTKSNDQKVRLLSEAIKLREKVMTDDSKDFQPNALSKNWMWNETAIKDWQLLLQREKPTSS